MTLASQAAGVGFPDQRGQKAVEAGSLSHSCLATSASQNSRAKDARDAVCPRRHTGRPAVLPPQPGGPEPAGLCRKALVCSGHRPVDLHPKPRVQGQGGQRGVPWFPGGGHVGAGSLLPGCGAPLLCLLAALGEGPRDDRSQEGQGSEGLLLKLLLCLPLKKTPSGDMKLSLCLGTEGTVSVPFLPGQLGHRSWG